MNVQEACADWHAQKDEVSKMRKSRIGIVAMVAVAALLLAACAPGADITPAKSYVVNDTGQQIYYNDFAQTSAPGEGEDYFGQDAQYTTRQMQFSDNGDGTVTDMNTGLMWQQAVAGKMSWDEAIAGAKDIELGGYQDWRLPTVKELYSLMDFSGKDPTGFAGAPKESLRPFINTEFFDFEYGDTEVGEKLTSVPFATSTKYVGTSTGELFAAFGVNFADGRVKGVGLTTLSGEPRQFFVRYVRGNPAYGQNQFEDNGDGTVTDKATGLMWMKADSGAFGAGPGSDGLLDWKQALEFAEGFAFAGYSDWRLPDAKELQSIVDYTRSPQSSNSAAIDPLFETTPIIDSKGGSNFGYYWTSTTHENAVFGGDNAVYFAFGDAQGLLTAGVEPDCACPTEEANVPYPLVDLHGAGAQRTDPKIGDPANFPYGRYAQSEIVRIFNLVRLVRVAS